MNDLPTFVYAGLALVTAVTIWAARRRRIKTHLRRAFQIGSQEKDEWPPQDAVVTKSFYAATTVVTQAQFAAWTTTPHYEKWLATSGLEEAHRNHFHGAGPDHPTERVTYLEAEAYCDWLNQSRVFPQGVSAQLPSEIEWEFMARAGTDTEYWSGDGPAALDEAGWYDGNLQAKTHPVAGKAGGCTMSMASSMRGLARSGRTTAIGSMSPLPARTRRGCTGAGRGSAGAGARFPPVILEVIYSSPLHKFGLGIPEGFSMNSQGSTDPWI